MSCLHEALQPAMITFASREVHSEPLRRSREIGVVRISGIVAGYEKQKGRKGSNMLKRLLSAAAMAASACAFVPAHAAHVHAARVGVGCSGDNLARTEGAVETMADGPGKFMAEREIAEAQSEMRGGRMRGCAMHLSRAMHSGSMTQAPYAQGPYIQGPYGNTMGQAPGGTTLQTPPQPQPGWKPIQPAL
jgi:hypothetical protein